jgi:protease IV
LQRAKRRLFRKLRRPPMVLVIPIHGAIAHAAGPFGGLSTDERVTRMIRAARHARRVRGVILHIDSPGGSALASDLMHHEIVQLAREKPVVACMANVAASGGYYVAAPAEVIVAEPTTVTGSIGVVAARLSLEPLLHRLGINTEVIERGKHATLLSPMGPLSEEDRAALMRELDATYKAFVGVVAAGREMPADDVERLARGRVYTGKDALDAGLVDVLGGFDVALAELKKLLKERDRDRVEVFLARPPRQSIPVLDPPDDDDGDDEGEEAKKKKAASLLLLGGLGALLPQSTELTLMELAIGKERVFAIGPISQT